jgi:cytochrome c oxidase assembly protein subunit 15
MVAQGAIGYIQYFTHLPALLVGVHVFGVTVLWAAMLWFADGLWHHPVEELLAPDGEPVAAAAAGDRVGDPVAAPVAPPVVPAGLAGDGLHGARSGR